jgi:NADP-dependent 3-hydroxy acid dehydrogenase YdfG/tetratricopeptide (TPR) repeat protein
MPSHKHHVLVCCKDNLPLANDIATDLGKTGYSIKTLAFSDEPSIENFGDAIARILEPVILLLTDNFLKTTNCMSGAFTAIQKLTGEGRLTTVIANGFIQKEDGSGVETVPTTFERVSHILPYMNFWQDRYLDLRKERKHHEDDITLEQKIETVRAISADIGELLRFLRAQKHERIEEFRAKDYAIFRQQNGENIAVEPPTDAAGVTEKTEEGNRRLVEMIKASSQELMAENVELDAQEAMGPVPEMPEEVIAQIPGIELLTPDANAEMLSEPAPPLAEKEDNTPTLDDLSDLVEMPENDIDWLLDEVIREEEEDDPIGQARNPIQADNFDLEALFTEGNDKETAKKTKTNTNPVEHKEKKKPNADEVLEVAIGLFESGQTEQAIGFLEGAVDGNPHDPKLRYYHAFALARYGQDYAGAYRQLEKLLKQNDNFTDAWYLLAELAELKQDFPAARRHFEKVAALQPDYPYLNYRLGLLTMYHFQGQEQLAADYFQRAIKVDGTNADAHFRLASLYNDVLEEQELALLHFKKALIEQPEHPFAHYDLAIWHYRRGEKVMAWDHYQQAIRINPELQTEDNDAAFRLEPVARIESPPLEIVPEEDLTLPVPEPPVETVSLEEMNNRNLPATENGENKTEEEDLAEIPSAGNLGDLEDILATPPPMDATATIPKAPEAPSVVASLVVKQAPPPTGSPIVMVTGGTSGIGRATAELFAQNGYRVVVTGRRADRLEAVQQHLSESVGANVHPLHFDVRDLNAVKNAIESLPEEWKNIDILINNAGLARGLAPIHEGDIEHWEEMIDTNIKGLLYLTRAVTPHMVARRQGHVINVASSAGKEVYPSGNVYCATKFAVDTLTKGMRLDLYQHNIRVSQVAPGHVEETEFARVRFDWDEEKAAKVYENFQPLRASDVAEVIYFIATRPLHVNIQDVLMFGTQQAGSTYVDRSGRR